MASIRLFGRGRTQAAPGGSPVSAAQIAQVLENVETASLSSTWRCRHSAGTSIGEGAVDFGSRRSRATVIRGKYAFEYVRSGSTVFRAAVEVDDPSADAKGKRATAASSRTDGGVSAQIDALDEDDEDEAELELEADEDDELDGDELEGDELEDAADLDDEGGDEDDDEPVVADASDEAGEAQARAASDEPDSEPSAEAGDESDSGAAGESTESKDDGDRLDWQTFSEHDPCGIHAYAEPAVLAAAVRAAGAVQSRDAQEFDGVTLAAYSVTLKPKPADADKAIARLARQLRDHGATMLVVTAFVDESGSGELDLTEEPDADNAGAAGRSSETPAEGGPRIVRLRVELPFWTPADDPTSDHAVSVDLFEFGEPVRIEVPDAGRATRRTSRTCADFALF